MRTLRYRLAVAVVGSLTAITTLVALPAPPATAQAADPVPARVSAQTGVRVVPNSDASLGNADLIGNGDVLVSTYGNPDALSFNVSKNDLYKDMSQQSSGAKDPAAPLRAGSVVVRIPALTSATYRQEQDPYRAEIRTVLAAGSTSVVERSRVLATSANVLATDVANTSGTPVSVTVDTVANQAFLTSGATTTAGTANGTTAWVSSTGPNGLGFGPANNPFRMRASMSTRVFGATATVSTGTAGTASSAFTIPPGATATVVTQIASTGGDVLTNTPADPLPTSNDGVDALSAQSVADLSTAHLGWWDTFWHRSSVQLDAEPTLMRYYYGALYMLASSNRAGAFAPGLNGWNGTDRPQYNGDYTTNYNVQAPYYGVYSSNHPELAQPYYTAILSINAEQGKALASSRGFQGTYFYTHYGPHGIQSDKAFGDGSQRTNALESTINFLNDYAYTRDTATLRAGYPFLRDVADFWDAYLVKDASGRYVVNDSTVAELDGAHKFNPTTALAFLRTFYSGILGAGQDLGLDAGRRAKWQDILANLATYTTVTSGGKQVFSFSEDNPSATANPYPYNLYPVFPAGQVGMNGPLAAVARNTISTRDYWTQGNSFNQIYPAAVRAGYPAPRVASTMTATLARMGPDNIIKQPGGGIETAGGIEAVNSMLLQSTENVLRVFPNWTGTDASFTDLRAVGAFTVSSGLAGGVVQDVRITSEKGQPLTVQNPWPGKALVVTASGGGAVPTTRSAGNYALATGGAERVHRARRRGEGIVPGGLHRRDQLAGAERVERRGARRRRPRVGTGFARLHEHRDAERQPQRGRHRGPGSRPVRLARRPDPP